MKIPSYFYIYGLKINVKFKNDLKDSNKNSILGRANYATNTIYLSKKIKSKELMEHTYLHEVLHFIILHANLINNYKLDNGKLLYEDETFIDNVSALLHQSFKTQVKISKRKTKNKL